MEAPQQVTTDHVRRLLAAEGPAVLTLVEGRVEVADEGTGTLDLISRDELVAWLGEDPSDAQVEDQAGALTNALQQLGG
ncbi:MAG: hypothetical protein PGN07_03420 [Aeromicrobium erythreum]